MYVDKSHSKKDIIILFKNHGIILDKELTKRLLISKLDYYIDYFKYDDEIKNLTELKEYLKNECKKQKPIAEEKQALMMRSKKIIKWYQNDYLFEGAIYSNSEEVYNDAMAIHMWGDFPTVRRALRLYNNSPCCHNHINPKISPIVEKQLIQDKITKKETIYCLTIKRAEEGKPFIVNFD